MHCNSCAQLIEKEFKNDVNKIYVSYAEEEAIIDFDENKISEEDIINRIQKLGYEAKSLKSINEDKINKIAKDVSTIKSETKQIEALEKDIEKREEEIDKGVKELKNEEEPDLTNKIGQIVFWALIGLIVIGGFYYLYTHINLPNIQIPELGTKASLALLFLAGIFTGFHCISMCGGFVMSYTAKNAINGHKSFKQHLIYGGSKVISYAIMGGIFGFVGGVVAFSIGLRSWVAILSGIFMIFYALSMFGLKFFRKFQFNPKFLTRAAASAGSSAKGPYKAPLITGLLNGLFIACGPLQAMYLYAVGTGNFVSGAASLMAFGLGTLPVMLGFGTLVSSISHKTTGKILKFSAIIVLILGLIMINRGLALSGSNFSFDSIKVSIIGVGASNSLAASNNANIVNGIQEINMDVGASGYSPNSFVLKKGVPVKWNVNVKQLTSCNSELVLNAYSIDKNLKNGINVIEFTPDKVGTITFTCGMGMLRGSFIVTETGTATQSEVVAATPASGGSCSMGSGGGGCGCGG